MADQRKRFGVFEPVLGESGEYSTLLYLGSREAVKAVSEVVKCCRAARDIRPEIGGLLDDANWRPHIVGAVAICANEYDAYTMSRLWRAFDLGSWVTPQLAVTAYLRDPEFAEHARTRIAARCPVDVSQLVMMTAVERHSATGPAGERLRSAKATAALMCLTGLLRPAPAWLEKEKEASDLVALVAEDVDHADRIVEDWLAKMKVLLKAMGIEGA